MNTHLSVLTLCVAAVSFDVDRADHELSLRVDGHQPTTLLQTTGEALRGTWLLGRENAFLDATAQLRRALRLIELLSSNRPLDDPAIESLRREVEWLNRWLESLK